MDLLSRKPGVKRRWWRWPWSRDTRPVQHIYYEEMPHSPLYGADADDDDFAPGALGTGGIPLGGEPAPQNKPRTRWWWIRRGIAAFFILFLLMIGWLMVTAPLSKSLQPIAPPELTLLAADGTPIARNGAVVDKPVKVADLPPHVTQAFIAIEDRRFYDHWGVDPRGIARAAWSNLTTGRTQGGSTITQQLAKFTFLTPEQNLTRKAREALIAFWLEAWLTKDEILERYLSNAYFGDNVYGLRAASLHYFYRQPEKLKPEQAAMLAGLLQAPSRYAPTKNYKLAEERMRVVLQTMVEVGYLTQAEAKAMRSPRLDVRDGGDDLPTGTYFADWALPEARKLTEAGYGGQTITTTLDSRLQAAARRAVSRAGLGKAQVALVAMRPNGEVVAMIGGKDYEDSPFNRATQARRQPGSTFKLFVYLAALRDGMSPDDTIDNSAFETGSYRPANASGSYSDSITLKDAFARSSNVAAVRLFGQVGGEKVIETARDLGVTSPLAEGDPSLALGTSSMTLLELTSAYAGVAGNAFPVKPRAVKAEEAGWFDWLWNSQQSLSSREHEGIEELLRAAVNRGTGRAAMLNVPNFGKTGTSQDNRDALFVGYAGDLVVGVWVGNDDNTPLAGVHGGGLPARIWKDFMSQALGPKAVPARQRETPQPDPSGPIQPLDVPDAADIPIGNDGTNLRVQEGEAVLSTQVGGTPVDVRLNNNGLTVVPGAGPPRSSPSPSPTS
ncbi:transglycosylase domain-containing protein [Erythrobacter sp. SG61-1L]|uniref:transglycosylase domain-containing protein n=1 Tax=Erythrobacter sp. SG61-1L TaxID=1603897 RepID=UPI000ADED9E5|nr:transglycosylase domain-containing protein [Erythrobacter sp. SG61-1L]